MTRHPAVKDSEMGLKLIDYCSSGRSSILYTKILRAYISRHISGSTLIAGGIDITRRRAEVLMSAFENFGKKLGAYPFITFIYISIN